MSDMETWFVHARLDEEVGTLVLADVPGKDHDIVADCWDGGKQDHDVAARRARLIAAAPELLEALQAVVAISDRKHDAWDAAKAAIAKATTP